MTATTRLTVPIPFLAGLVLFAIASTTPASADAVIEIYDDSLTAHQLVGTPTLTQDVQTVEGQRWSTISTSGGDNCVSGNPDCNAPGCGIGVCESVPVPGDGDPIEDDACGEDCGSPEVWEMTVPVPAKNYVIGPGNVSNDGGTELCETELSLPAPGPGWSIGRSFNNLQHDGSSAHDSAGYQGNNWYQNSQPQILLYEGATDDQDMIYLTVAANRFLEYKRANSSSDEFRGVNGALGVFEYIAGSGGEPDLYTLTTIKGTRITFFGFGASASPAEGQRWKVEDPAGNVAYVGHSTTASTAVASGFDATTGAITTAYDSAGRKYEYTYNGDDKLTKVEVFEDNGGGWTATGHKVEYSYYGSGESDGLEHDLKLVAVTTPLSESGVTLVRKKHYRYWTAAHNPGGGEYGHPHLIKYVYDYEGTRRYDWDQDSVLDDDFLTATEGQLKSYASQYFEYDSDRRVSKTWRNGDCGCGGGSANGVYEFTYETNGSYSDTTGYTTTWQRRTIIERPDGSYVTQYFDEIDQPLTLVVSDGDPSLGGTNHWILKVVRDSNGQITSVHAPANATGYTHSSGAVTSSTTAGLVWHFDRKSSGDLKGFLEHVKYSEGTSGTQYLMQTVEYTQADLAFDDVTMVRPMISSTWEYTEQTSTEAGGSSGPSGAYETSYAHTFWDSSETVLDLARKTVTVTRPAVSTSKNGSGTATSESKYFNKDETIGFTKSADSIISYREYDGGLLVKSIQDADTTRTGSGEDFEFVAIPTGFSSSGTPLHRVSTYTYDSSGRRDTATPPSGKITKAYHSKLADNRRIMLSYPKYDDSGTTTYYGPVSFSVQNLAGRSEAGGTIALSGGMSTETLANHVDETESDPIQAIETATNQLGTVDRLNTSIYADSGAQLQESRAYFDIPASLPGTDGTNYDATQYAYDGMGRRTRVEDPTGTIRKTVYDIRGRVSEQWIGTDDTGGGTDNMVKVSAIEYDSGNAGGNSYVTTRTAYVEDSTTDQRQTTYEHDVLGRVLIAAPPDGPQTLNTYDNLGRLIASGQYKQTATLTAGTDDPTTTATDRLALMQTFYDERGRVWKSQRHEIDAADGSDDDHLQTLTWYDAVGRVIKTDGVQLTKTFYDRIGRTTHQFTLASDDDSVYGDADDMSGDIVLVENRTTYDPTTGWTIMQARIDRHHDDYGVGETTGALDSNADGDDLLYTAANLEGRIQITAMWHDDLGRTIDTVAYGTNGGSDFDRDGLSTPSPSDTELRTTYAYNDDGTLLSVTDPEELQTRYAYDDLGRQVAVISNYVDGTPSGATGADDTYVRYEYTDGLKTKMWVDLDGDDVEDADDQVTTYTFGTTKGASAGDSKVATGNLLQEIAYPDSGGASDVVQIAYNAQGQEIWRQDQAGNVTEYTYDDAGRRTAQAVTTLAGGFDGAVRRIEMAYDDLGRRETVTQYDAASAGSVVDEVKYAYDGWSNVATIEQDVNSAVGAMGSVDDYDVSFSYEKATNGRNTLRRTGVTLPSGDAVSYAYSNAHALHDEEASRVSQVTFAVGVGTTVATYQYNGQGHLVKTNLPEPAVFSFRSGATSGSYPDLDRFNRVTTSDWTSGSVDFYNVDLTYDRNGNIETLNDHVHDGFDVLFTMDDLNRLIDAQEGTLSGGGGSISSETRQETWTLGQTGTWEIFQRDLDGDGLYTGASELDDGRAFNVANELTERDTKRDGTPDYAPTYDAVGNLTDDEEHYQYIYDAFGRLRKVQTTGVSPRPVAEYTYNGLNWRIGRHYDVDGDNSVDGDDPWYSSVFDDMWRVVAVYRGSDTQPKEQYVYHAAGLDGRGGSSYIDDVILRDFDDTGGWGSASDGMFETRQYYCQNWRHDVVAVINERGGQVEQVRYSSYGVPFGLPAGDADSDGDVESSDLSQINTWAGGSYDVRGDLDLDGDVDGTDHTIATARHGDRMGRQTLSLVNNRLGYAGYRWMSELSGAYAFHHVRHRVLNSSLGVWMTRDPMDAVDGPNLYAYVTSAPLTHVDLFGLCKCECSKKGCKWNATFTAKSSIASLGVGVTWGIEFTVDANARDSTGCLYHGKAKVSTSYINGIAIGLGGGRISYSDEATCLDCPCNGQAFTGGKPYLKSGSISIGIGWGLSAQAGYTAWRFGCFNDWDLGGVGQGTIGAAVGAFRIEFWGQFEWIHPFRGPLGEPDCDYVNPECD